jgi:hypothetical protein
VLVTWGGRDRRNAVALSVGGLLLLATVGLLQPARRAGVREARRVAGRDQQDRETLEDFTCDSRLRIACYLVAPCGAGRVS